jgi:NAD(P)-dependent dehydrogenase (short-subunit alcohol dehydrogenase family)
MMATQTGLAGRMNLQGRTALVTGGGAGLGQEIARSLAALGARVAVLDLQGDAAEKTAASLDGSGHLALACDVADGPAVQRSVERVLQDSGRLDIVVNSAGVTSRPGMPFTNNTDADWDRVWDINVKGAVHVCGAARQALIDSGSGRIVNLSSVVGVISAPYMPPYTVSKAALISLSKVLARELAVHHVTVNAVCPGFIWTPLWQDLGQRMAAHDRQSQGNNAREVFEGRVRQHVPMQRAQTCEDVADAVAFFCSGAASNITGQVIGIDGGVTI